LSAPTRLAGALYIQIILMMINMDAPDAGD
jgi:hypothetical protein